MATDTNLDASGDTDLRAWLSGVAGGLVAVILTGLVMQFAFDPTILSEDVPGAVGLAGLAGGWLVLLLSGALVGLLYAGIAALDPVAGYAILPNTGAFVGLVFGIVLWLLAVAVFGYDVTDLQALLGYALFGLVVGLVYGVSPYTGVPPTE